MVEFGKKKDGQDSSKVADVTGMTSQRQGANQDSRLNSVTDLYKVKEFQDDATLVEFKERLFDAIIKHIDLSVASKMPFNELKQEIEGYLVEYTKEMNIRINYRELQQVVDDIINDMVGLGPLEILLADKAINDIMVNSYNKIYIESKGKLYITDVRFRNEKHVSQIAQRIANQVGRRVDESSPMVDARLKDGSRVNIIIPPIALEGTTISIRKFPTHAIHLDNMVQTDNLSSKMYTFLKMAAAARFNIIVSGGTGAGKTTLLNALSELIDNRERIISLEDAAELRLMQPHVVRLESRPANIEGQGQVTICDLLKNALRMRPDRIIIGECRGAEAFDMLQAMNTGHDGSMSTIHANSATEALDRLENLVLMSGHDLPAAAIKHYIVDAVDVIVQIARMKDGVRRVVQIVEVCEVQNGSITTKEIFSFHHLESTVNKIVGEFLFKGLSSEIVEKIENGGQKEELDKFLQDL